MIWRSLALVVSTSLLLTFGYFELRTPRHHPPKPTQSQAQQPASHAPAQSAPPETKEEDKSQPLSATPEDTSLYTRIVGPLSIWMKEAEAKAHKEKPVETPEQQQAQEAQEVSASDHVDITPTPAAQHFLHQRFTLKRTSNFAFVVPSHQMNPQLHGKFRAFLQDGSSTSRPGQVGFLLMNRQEYSDYVLHKEGGATFGADPAPRADVRYALPPTHDEAQEYHLIFSNDARTAAVVDADFTVSFE